MHPAEMEADQWRAWRDRPETQAFFLYLADQRRFLMERWARGHPVQEQDQGRAAALSDLCDIEFGDIEECYEREDAKR